MSREFEFVRPPEAPVFEPTEEEFVDALAYIAKIKPIAEKTGICKIRPPAKWQPPFAIDIENFRFTPRVQRLNELEALSRIKLNFLDRLARFWELQGYRLRIPNVERKSLDLHGIHKIVHEEGGFESVCRERRWTYVGIRLGFGASVHKGGITSALRNHYERILYPFDLFEAGVSLEPSKWKDFIANSRMPPKASVHPSKKTPPASKRSRRAETKVDEIDYSANKELRKLQFFGPGPKAAVPAVKNEEDMEEESRDGQETCDVQTASPALEGEVKEEMTEEKESETKEKSEKEEEKQVEMEPSEKVEEKKEENEKEEEEAAVKPKESPSKEASPATASAPAPVNPPKSRMATRSASEQAPAPHTVGMRTGKSVIVSFANPETEPRPKTTESGSKTLEQYNCCVCQLGDREAQLLLCDECDDAYHTFCLFPPLPDVPRGDWRCPQCVAKVCNRPPIEYGFEQSKKQYTLQEFGEMADQFKVNYFKKDIHEIAYNKLEYEFWRLLQSLGEDVVVEYGADIHAAEKGSGFPTKPAAVAEEDRHYTESAWNLNVLPVVDKSVLRFIGMDISGMKIPWCYVGMCFSCFCWHIEDHWSYSINYMHWGEPKTWYGVSSHDADLFENAMKSHAPELFEQSPDLLHHITTIMNPNLLQRAGVPIYRTDQHAGEFVITFPRAYHAGFNNGYNFAEAVNFCPADWLPMGRQCVEHYATLRRTCVFSHDETVCKMASRTSALDVEMAAIVALEMEEMLDRERQLRRRLLDAGVRSTQREEFELLADDHRMCVCCRTTCFLSAVTCKCGSATRMACARHADDLCSCEPARRTLRYRYSLDELAAMIAKLRERVDSFSAWRKQVKAWLRIAGGSNEKPTLSQVQAHLEEAKRKDYAAKDEKAANLVKRLRGILSEAETLGKVAKDFFVHERRRATRLRADNPLAKLAVDDFFKFAEAIERLPCQVPDVIQLCNLRNRIESFQTEANRQLLSDRAERDVKRIEEMLDFGCAQDIALPEVGELRKLLERERWLQDVDRLLSPSLEVKQEAVEEEKEEDADSTQLNLPGAGDVELGQLCSLIEAGEQLQQKPEVLETLERLRHLKLHGMELEDQAARHLGSRSSPEEVARFLSEDAAEVVSGSDPRLLYLPNVEELRRALQTARKWYSDYSQQLTTNGTHYPTVATLEALLDRAQRCRVRVAPKKVDKLDAHVRLARGWLDQTSRFFLKRRSSSAVTLLELLLPRPARTFDPAATPFLSTPRAPPRPPSKSSKASGTLTNTGQNCQEFAKEMNKENMDCASAYSAMVAAELEAAQDWRARNTKRSEDECALYCLCRREQSDFMLQCDLCRDWFHAECIALPKVLEKAALSCGRKLSGPDRKGKSKKKGNKAKDAASNWSGRESQVRDLKYLCPRCQRGRRPQLGTIYGLLLSLQQLPVRMPEGEALQLLTERAMAWQDSVHAFLSGGPEDVRTAFAAYARLWSVELPPELATKMPAIDLDEDDETLMRLQQRLRDESRVRIEALLLQGDLIEVSLEETKWLWQLLQMSQSRPQPASSVEDPKEDAEAEAEVEVEVEVEEEEEEEEAELLVVDVEASDEPPAKAARLES